MEAAIASEAASGARILAAARRLVVKVGSSLLVDSETGRLRQDWLAGLAEDIGEMRGQGKQVLLVSSGAIALGRHILSLPAGPLTLEDSQAAAAVGQIRLARAYEEVLAPLNIPAAQVLLTLSDTQDRRRYLNARATLDSLLRHGAAPIANENDTVATDEIRYGDNDRLGARVAQMAGADVLILLSDVDGLYTANPRTDPTARRLDMVEEITPEIAAMADGAGTTSARGGMRTKLLAAKTAMRCGCAMVVTRGDVDRPLTALAAGAPATWFRPDATPAAARKQWISGMKPQGALIIDAGAANALRQGKSLLPAGVREVTGEFDRGDPVTIDLQDGGSLGAALAGYNADEARRIVGVKTVEIQAVLGYPVRAAMAHRDDMVLWEGAKWT